MSISNPNNHQLQDVEEFKRLSKRKPRFTKANVLPSGYIPVNTSKISKAIHRAYEDELKSQSNPIKRYFVDPSTLGGDTKDPTK